MTTIEESTEIKNKMIRTGLNFLGILNDLKRRPIDAAKELDIPLSEIEYIIEGKKELSPKIISRATKVWPVNEQDFFVLSDDCPHGIKIMRAEESIKSSRIMERAGKPYYEYRDTAMSCIAPFRPEWISELCYVDDNDPNNKLAQWNNGHFMHQFTYFIGEVNFYYKGPNGENNIAVMNTGDSMYITPFVPHTFTTRNSADKNGLILAITYGNKLTGDPQNELSVLRTELGSQFVLDFTSKEKSAGSLLKFHRQSSSVDYDELSKRSNISIEKLKKIENGQELPSYEEYEKIADALHVNIRDLLPDDKIENKVIVQKHDEARMWTYPDSTNAYTLVELASTNYLPFSKALEISINENDNEDLDLKVGLHQYGYNVGDSNLQLNWQTAGKNFKEIIKPGDTFYIKPFVPHNFRGKGKILVLRLAGKVVGESQRELSFIGKEKVERSISETIQWFDPQGKN